MTKLKYREVQEYRVQQLFRQNYRCALCNDRIEDDAVLDHDHKTGLVRKVLHRGCNSLLGKVENGMPRSLMTLERLEVWSKNLFTYIQTQHTEYLHPTYRTIEERKMRKKQRGGGKKRRG